MRCPRFDSQSVLGYGGALPFVLAALATQTSFLPAELARSLLFNYGGVILSFVGALYWGFAMQTPAIEDALRVQLYIWSVLPALIAWFALSIGCPPLTAGFMIAGFGAQWLLDTRVRRLLNLPAWYLRLRTQLTLVAILSLALGGFF